MNKRTADASAVSPGKSNIGYKLNELQHNVTQLFQQVGDSHGLFQLVTKDEFLKSQDSRKSKRLKDLDKICSNTEAITEMEKRLQEAQEEMKDMRASLKQNNETMTAMLAKFGTERSDKKKRAASPASSMDNGSDSEDDTKIVVKTMPRYQPGGTRFMCPFNKGPSACGMFQAKNATAKTILDINWSNDLIWKNNVTAECNAADCCHAAFSLSKALTLAADLDMNKVLNITDWQGFQASQMGYARKQIRDHLMDYHHLSHKEMQSKFPYLANNVCPSKNKKPKMKKVQK